MATPHRAVATVTAEPVYDYVNHNTTGPNGGAPKGAASAGGGGGGGGVGPNSDAKSHLRSRRSCCQRAARAATCCTARWQSSHASTARCHLAISQLFRRWRESLNSSPAGRAGTPDAKVTVDNGSIPPQDNVSCAEGIGVEQTARSCSDRLCSYRPRRGPAVNKGWATESASDAVLQLAASTQDVVTRCPRMTSAGRPGLL